MQRTALSCLAAWLCVFGVACSENPNELKHAGDGRPVIIVNPTETLDQSVIKLLGLFPKGLETAATARWSNVKTKYAAGLSDPSQMPVAKQMLFELSDWVSKKTPDMDTPPNGETKSAAGARAVLYMSMYVYSGPGTTPPPFTPSADAVVGLVTPGAPATIVTPTKHAGVQLEAGSVAENTIVVITQNPTPYPANCSGPLQTKLCQYPQFYTFDEFPHKTLLKPGKFNVCHVNSGDNRRPLADHDRFRLAHTKPTDPADYTPGSTIRDQNGESIEILPLIAQTFSTCTGNFYADNSTPGRGLGVFSRLARGIQEIVTPRTAYAIDLGLGGSSKSMSPFNDVDPQGVPDRSVQSLNVATVCGQLDCLLHPGGHIGISYAVTNIGTATGNGVPGTIHVVSLPQNPEDPGLPVDVSLGSVDIPALVPGAIASESNVDFVIPATLSPGSYTLRFSVGEEPTFPEPASTLANNTATAPLVVAPSGAAPNVVRVCATPAIEGPPTVSDLQAAMQLVAPRGTIRICDGTYMVTQMDLNPKSMTIEGEGPGIPTLDAANTAQVFYMDSPTPVNTSVLLRRLRLQNGQFGPVNVSHYHGALFIDSVEFHPPHGLPPNNGGPPDLAYLAGLGVFDAVGTIVSVQNSTFIGGDIGVHVSNAANVIVLNNTFTGQLNAAITGGNGGDLLAANNTISNCGIHWCVGLFGTALPSNYRLLDNVITVAFPTGPQNAIQVNSATIQMSGNQISGSGGGRVPSDPSTWPMQAAIAMDGASSVALSGNTITGAHTGLFIFNGTSVTGTANILTNVSQGINLFRPGAVAINRSDFTQYTSAYGGVDIAGSLQCNWWGSVNGPTGIIGGVNVDIYTPWSLEPIARNNDLACPAAAP